jgi:hypothetical protein
VRGGNAGVGRVRNGSFRGPDLSLRATGGIWHHDCHSEPCHYDARNADDATAATTDLHRRA